MPISRLMAQMLWLPLAADRRPVPCPFSVSSTRSPDFSQRNMDGAGNMSLGEFLVGAHIQEHDSLFLVQFPRRNLLDAEPAQEYRTA